MSQDEDSDSLNLHLSALLKEMNSLDSEQLSPLLAEVTALQATLLTRLLALQHEHHESVHSSDDHLLTVEEAAQRLGTSKDWLYRHANKLPFTVRLGSRQLRFSAKGIEQRYLKKIRYLTFGQYITLIFDDSLVERNGKNVEETQSHKDHSTDSFITGHQFFTSLIHTSFIQLPLFPKLYSKNTESKIEMALDLIDNVIENVGLNRVLMDSWYSDKKIIKKCMTKHIKVICGIKANRNVSIIRGEYKLLSEFSKNVSSKEFEKFYIDEKKYKIASFNVKLNGIPTVKMLISKEFNDDNKKWRLKIRNKE